MGSILALVFVARSLAVAHPCDDVWPDACVDPSVIVAPDVVVGSGVDLGPYVVAQDGVVFAGRSSVAGREVGTQPVENGADSVIGRRAMIGFDASIGAHVTFLPQVSGGRDLRAAVNAVVRLGTIVGDSVRLGDGAVVGSRSFVGDQVVVAAQARLARSVTVGQGARISGQVGPEATIGASAILQSDVRVRKGAVLGEGVLLSESARVGRSATVGPRVGVGDGDHMRAGGEVCEGTVVDAGRQPC